MIPEFILRNLKKHDIKYESWNHDSIKTSQEAASLRDTPLHKGVKSMILYSKKQDKGVAAFVSGDRRINLKKLREITGINDLKLASFQKAYELSGLKVGGISPLGFKTPLDVYVDRHVLKNEEIWCSATSETSVKLKARDLLALNQNATVADFSEGIN